MHNWNKRVTAKPELRAPILRWLAGAAAPATDWDTPTVAPADAASTDEACVLVVDDDPFNWVVAAEMFACLGVTPLLATDGAQAVGLASQLRLDLILMDLQMPVLDGLAAARQIRRNELALARPRVPVLAFTSTRPTVSLSAFGIDGVLDKPCDVQALRACLRRWCPLKGQAWA